MLKIHLLNVGKGNCTIIDFPSGRLSMIDIDNSRKRENDEILTDPMEYFQNKFGDRELFRFILTHPDMDHMSGLNALADKASILNFWDTKHDKTLAEDDWKDSPYDRQDWERYLKFRDSTTDPKCLLLYRGATSDCCWIQDGLKVLSPSPHLVELANSVNENDPQKYHHLSYVLMLEYAGIKVLFGGDASTEAWEEILGEYGKDSLKSNVFLAPHHGSKNNIHETAFQAIAPDYVVISVARGIDYDYDFYSGIAKERVLSTKHNGTIRLEIDESGQHTIFVDRNP